MPVKLLLHGWTLAESPMVRLLTQHPGFLAGHCAARRLALTRENDSPDERGAIVAVRDRR